MQDLDVKRGETATLDKVEGDLRVGSGAKIKAANGKRAVVTGGVWFEGSAEIECDFDCGSMRLVGHGYGFGGNIDVAGDLTVQKGADIDAALSVEGNLKAEYVDVGGHLKAKDIVSGRVRVGGHLRAEGKLEAGSVEVGGHLTVAGNVKLGDLRVGGHVKVGGGVISGRIQVRGHITTASKLEFGELELFGHVKLPAGSKGEKIMVFGTAEFLGDASCRVMQAKGSVKVNGDYAAEDVEVSGKLEVQGSLNVSKRLEVDGVAEVERKVTCGGIVVAGKLMADSVIVDGEADIGGEVKSNRYLKGKSILVRKGSKIAGTVVGEQVEIGRAESSWGHWVGLARIGQMTDVQDIYGHTVSIGSYSRVKRIFAETVEMDNGSIAEQVTFTKELKLPASYYMNKPPVKATTLPEFPA
jgi:cytoskeletal protein CcmA (bactofilin family)